MTSNHRLPNTLFVRNKLETQNLHKTPNLSRYLEDYTAMKYWNSLKEEHTQSSNYLLRFGVVLGMFLGSKYLQKQGAWKLSGI